jgi:hypothetical protein
MIARTPRAAASTGKPAPAVPPPPPPFLSALRSPEGARTAIVLAEVLGPPVALR